MKYESTILKRLIDTYGVVGNPRYISEIIKEFIVRGKECFPNLFTYQSDWLAHIDEFGLTPEYTVSYTGQHIYAPNTKEKPVKSAILKGQTLVNLFKKSVVIKEMFPNCNSASFITLNGEEVIKIYGNNGNRFKLISTPKTSFTIKMRCSLTSEWGSAIQIVTFFKDGSSVLSERQLTTNVDELTEVIYSYSGDKEIDYISFDTSGGFSAYLDVDNLVIIEGDYTNVDIPYFEGMQSVKLPVLTTSNEDGTKTNILTVNEDVTLRSNGSVCDELDLLTGKLTQRIDEDGEVLVQEVVKTVELTIHNKDNQKVERLTTFEGGTHFTTSSQDGSLLPTLTVDVVTDLEKTLMVCSLEGNTM